jgi:hypothetical protein
MIMGDHGRGGSPKTGAETVKRKRTSRIFFILYTYGKKFP